jgi:hypothetical protein
VAVLTAVLATAGGGTAVVASNLADDYGASTAITAADAGTRPGGNPDVVARGVIEGKAWQVSARVDGGPQRICYTEDTGLVPERTCSVASPEHLADPGLLGWAASVSGHGSGSGTHLMLVTGEAGSAVAYVEVTWPGAAAPLRVFPVSISGTPQRVFAFAVEALGGRPDITLTGYDAAGNSFSSDL